MGLIKIFDVEIRLLETDCAIRFADSKISELSAQSARMISKSLHGEKTKQQIEEIKQSPEYIDVVDKISDWIDKKKRLQSLMENQVEVFLKTIKH